MQTTKTRLPHWDMSVVYPGLDSPEFEAGFQRVLTQIEQLQTLFDEHQIGVTRTAASETLDSATIALFERVLNQFNSVLSDLTTLRAYISSFVTTNSRNTLAQARLSELQQKLVQLNKLGTRLTAWLGHLPVDALIEQSALAADHAYALRKAQTEAAHLLTPAEEELAAELAPTGGSAWAKLYTNFTSQLLVPIELDGEIHGMPMSNVRNLAYHPQRETRQAAFVAELRAWEEASVPIAAALNGVKGEVNTLVQRRGWESALTLSLFQNNMDQPTLEAMMEAARESFPDFRRYLRAKAQVLGLPALAWYDLFAPTGSSNYTWQYGEARDFIVEQFGTFSPRMQALAQRAFNENWIDAEPRTGKRDGAFCMSLRGEESRILANYKENFNAVGTLAHELGHAYHNLNLARRTYTQQDTPMTLAETASNFCETIVNQAALRRMAPAEQFAILENSLQDACQVVVDITSRFLFEKAVFEKRWQRELSSDEFCDLMLDAQRQTYGDGLDQEQLHPYMWAAKGHYYSTDRSFYNYPYMFGLLFALGLYARYEENPSEFRRGYDDLLSATGMYPAAELANRFGIDIRTPDFWRGSLNVIRADIDRFEGLVAGD